MKAHKHRRPRKTKAPARKPTAVARQRHFYDVRQYALLTDSAGHLLILQLPKEYDEAAANTWTLPGGKLEPNDIPGEGLLREIVEETGLQANLKGPCSVMRWSTRNSKKLAVFYKAEVSGEKPKFNLSSEHQRAVWAKLSEIDEFPFHREEMLEVIRQQC